MNLLQFDNPSWHGLALAEEPLHLVFEEMAASFLPAFSIILNLPILLVDLSLDVLSRQVFLFALGPLGLEVPELLVVGYDRHWVATTASEQLSALLYFLNFLGLDAMHHFIEPEVHFLKSQI